MGDIFGADVNKDRIKREQQELEAQLEEQKAAKATEDKKIQLQRLDALRARRGRPVQSSLVPPNQTLG